MSQQLQRSTAPGAGRTRPDQPKAKMVERMLRRSRGATIAEVSTGTGWQSHSVRAHLSGLRKKGAQLVKEARKGGETSYRIKKLAPASGSEDA